MLTLAVNFIREQAKLIAVMAGLSFISTVSSYVYFYYFDHTNQAAQAAAVLPATAPLSLESLPSPDSNLKTLNFLLLGYGGPGHEGGFLTDVVMMVHVNFEKRHLAFISLPRDLWITMPDESERKLNAVFVTDQAAQTTTTDIAEETAANLAKNMKAVVTAITGIPIHYFIGVDFVGFQKLIGEELDGIEVEVKESLDDPWYPIKGEELNLCGMSPEEIEEVHEKYSGFELERQFTCRYEHLHFDKGIVHMEGGDALKFVRSRHGSAGGDFSRSQRQMAVLRAVGKKLLSLKALDNSVNFFAKLRHTIKTDIDSTIIEKITPAFNNVGNYSIKEIVLSTDNVFTTSTSANGAFIVIPKAGYGEWENIHAFIQGQLEQ